MLVMMNYTTRILKNLVKYREKALPDRKEEVTETKEWQKHVLYMRNNQTKNSENRILVTLTSLEIAIGKILDTLIKNPMYLFLRLLCAVTQQKGSHYGLIAKTTCPINLTEFF